MVLTNLYGKRMTVEELFRDAKNKRNGFSLLTAGVDLSVWAVVRDWFGAAKVLSCRSVVQQQ